MAPQLPLEHVEAIGSTSRELMDRADRGAAEVALMAGRQLAGQGRLGRPWRSIDGNLHLSVLLRPAGAITPGHWSLLAAVALADALAGALPPTAALRLKWPNDVLLDEGKLAGILLDAGSGVGGAWLVIGFGVNLAAVPDGVGRAASCVADHAPPPPPAAFAPALLHRLAGWRDRYGAEGFGAVRDAWLRRGPAPGAPLEAGTGTAHVAGRFGGIRHDGALMLDAAAGRVAITAGEVR